MHRSSVLLMLIVVGTLNTFVIQVDFAIPFLLGESINEVSPVSRPCHVSCPCQPLPLSLCCRLVHLPEREPIPLMTARRDPCLRHLRLSSQRRSRRRPLLRASHLLAVACSQTVSAWSHSSHIAQPIAWLPVRRWWVLYAAGFSALVANNATPTSSLSSRTVPVVRGIFSLIQGEIYGSTFSTHTRSPPGDVCQGAACCVVDLGSPVFPWGPQVTACPQP